MNKLFEQLLKSRNLTPDFLHPKYEDLSDPFLLLDVEPAVARIKTALKNREKILIYGDYDADGVTASTLMEEALKLAGADPKNLEIMLPNRFTDGYGMSPRMVEYAKKQKINLVITVDCGSGSLEIVEDLKAANIDTIITDHHETRDVLPNAVAVISNKRHDFTPKNGLENLAGVGVAFKLAEALVKAGSIKPGQEKWLLDLVLIGTICDSMLLTEENRILCYYGFKVLEKTRRPGLKELMRLAKVKNLNSEAIGFQIGPRLNAAGRLKDANLSLNLLRTASKPEAATLASELEELNKQRKTEQQSATKEIKARQDATERKDPVIVEVGNYHEGILGIVAGNLTEDYARPSFVLSEVEPGILKGSGRSFGDFNLAEALSFARETIEGGGGHAAAAGVRLRKEKLEDFRAKLNEYYRSLNLTGQEKYLKTSPDLTLTDFSDLTLDLLADLRTLEPFGPGNEEPIFLLKNLEITNVSRMGPERNHLRLDLADKNGKHLKTLCFFAPENWLNLTPDDNVELLVKLVENDFNGVKSLEAQICDISILESEV